MPGLRGPTAVALGEYGGDDRDRTGDLLVANEALSQLSYIPTDHNLLHNWRREWDSNPRSTFMLTRFPTVLLQPLGHLSGKLRFSRAPWRAVAFNGGERGIRTLDTLTRIAVFETARFSHSRISPRGRIRESQPHFQPVPAAPPRADLA